MFSCKIMKAFGYNWAEQVEMADKWKRGRAGREMESWLGGFHEEMSKEKA